MGRLLPTHFHDYLLVAIWQILLAEQDPRLMVGKAWRLARTRRRRAAWAAEAVSVVWLAAVIAPVTGGAKWLTSPMMVLRQALAPCSRNLCTAVPIAAERVGATRADQICRMRKERAHAAIRVAVRGTQRVGVNRYRKKTLFFRNSAPNREPP